MADIMTKHEDNGAKNMTIDLQYLYPEPFFERHYIGCHLFSILTGKEQPLIAKYDNEEDRYHYEHTKLGPVI